MNIDDTIKIMLKGAADHTAVEEINKNFVIIKNLKKKRMHERILEKLEDIKKIITVDI